MSDIVDKLVNPAGSGPAVALCWEARKEITRLRDEVERNKANIEIIKKMARDLNWSVDLRIGLHKAATIMEDK